MADDKNNIANVPTATSENEYVAALLAEIERLRSAGDALAEALHGWCNGMDAFTDDWERLRAWQEARRG